MSAPGTAPGGAPPPQADPRRGLCPECRHVRALRNDRGSTFLQCTLARSDPRFPRYPPQPRMVCPGFLR